jgi:hypothetical protein
MCQHGPGCDETTNVQGGFAYDGKWIQWDLTFDDDPDTGKPRWTLLARHGSTIFGRSFSAQITLDDARAVAEELAPDLLRYIEAVGNSGS